MSKEPRQNSITTSKPAREASQHAERVAHKASRSTAGGDHESVEVSTERFWTGALPHPEDFAKFAAVVPDAPERILRMAEKEQDHRISLESQIVPEGNAAGKRGQWLGAGISTVALALGALTAYWRAPWQVSVAMGGVPVLSVARSLVTAFKAKSE